MKILGISGSLRPKSRTLKIVQAALHKAARETDVKTEWLDLGECRMEFADGRSKGTANPPDMPSRLL